MLFVTCMQDFMNEKILSTLETRAKDDTNIEMANVVYATYMQDFTNEKNLSTLETSAKDGTNIEMTFITMASEIKKR